MTFKEWIKQFKDGDDIQGEIARLVCEDRLFPETKN